MQLINIAKLAAVIIFCELAGVTGSIFAAASIPGWYAKLNKPRLAPPNWIFSVVWIGLYALMGISVFLVWQKGLEDQNTRIALALFIIQLALNVIWSIMFFGLRSPGGSLVEIIILWLAIFATIIAFAKISDLAAWLLLPYLFWVSFAAFLNYGIYKLN